MPKFQKKVVIENKDEKMPGGTMKTMEPADLTKISPEAIKASLWRLQLLQETQEKRLPFWRRALQPVIYVLMCLMRAALAILATIGAAGLVAIFIVAVAKFFIKMWSWE